MTETFIAVCVVCGDVRQVMPREYEEIVLYLEGKRSLDQLLLEDGRDSL